MDRSPAYHLVLRAVAGIDDATRKIQSLSSSRTSLSVRLHEQVLETVLRPLKDTLQQLQRIVRTITALRLWGYAG